MDDTARLTEAVCLAIEQQTPLEIRGGSSKAFYGTPTGSDSHILHTTGHSGIIDYVPEELILCVRAGTPLSEVTDLLAEHNQILGFEPPEFGGGATIGGAVACGLSGPRRPYAGSVRDFVLGTTLLSGNGKVLSFGGKVMKNVAGYDVSRLMVGAMGTLGLILDVSLKVLPRPQEVTRRFVTRNYREIYQSLIKQSVGLSAMAVIGDELTVRVSESGAKKSGGDQLDNDFWPALRDQQCPAFSSPGEWWRLSVGQTDPDFHQEAAVIEWGGALRWVCDPKYNPHQTLTTGHATLFRSNTASPLRFHPLPPVLTRLHQNLKACFDPHNLFNRGKVNWYANPNT